MGVCAAARPICVQGEGRPDCEFPRTYEPDAEVTCDGLDNDCNGIVDDPDTVVPPEDDCLAVGVCRNSDWACFGPEGWACDYPGDTYVLEELGEDWCDGLDNDCDGTTDGAQEVTPPADTCPLAQGECEHARPRCAGGRGWACDFPPTYQADLERTCDDLDNDCDGRTDEAEDLEAAGEVQPEVCDGFDNNCNGTIDEDVVPPEEPCMAIGVCAGSDWVCRGEDPDVGGWACDYPADTYRVEEFGPDVCDGLDNDCDGFVDAMDECQPFGEGWSLRDLWLDDRGLTGDDRHGRAADHWRDVPVEIPLVAGGYNNSDVIAYWKLDGDLTDSGPHGLNGVLPAGLTVTTDRNGRLGGAIRFAGDEALYEGGPQALITDRSPPGTLAGLTVCTWLSRLPAGLGQETHIVSQFPDVAFSVFTLMLGDDDRARFILHPGPDQREPVVSAEPIGADGWHHLCGVSDADRLSLYVDGTLSASLRLPPNTLVARNQARARFRLAECGGADGDCAEPPFFQGALDEIVILRRALSPAEIRHYALSRAEFGAALTGPRWPSAGISTLGDSTARGDLADVRLTEGGSATPFEVSGLRPTTEDDHVAAYLPLEGDEAGVFGDPGGALRIEGEAVDTGIVVADVAPEAATIEVWARWNDALGNVAALFGQRAGERQAYMACYLDQLRVRLDADLRFWSGSVRPCMDRAWHHYALVIDPDADEGRWYLDGELISRSPMPTFLEGLGLALGGLFQDGEPAAGAYVTADELVVHDVARSDTWLADRARRVPTVRFLADTAAETDFTGRHPFKPYRLWWGGDPDGPDAGAGSEALFTAERGYVAWYRFEEGRTRGVRDWGPGGHHLHPADRESPIALGGGGFGAAGLGPGTPVALPVGPLAPSEQGFTAEVVLRGDAGGATLLNQSEGDAAFRVRGVDLGEAGFALGCSLPIVGALPALHEELPDDQTWTSYVCTADAEEIAAYVDGRLDAAGAVAEPAESEGPLWVGAAELAVGRYAGVIDEVRILDRRIDMTERLRTGPLYWRASGMLDPLAADLDGDGVLAEDDCDDLHAGVSPEIEADRWCDGYDNDCNGVIDDADPIPADKQDGLCAGLLKLCDDPADGPFEPAYAQLDDYELVETLCDGHDNDCDGEIDEGEPPAASLTQGVCEGQIKECLPDGGGWQDPPFAEVVPRFEAGEETRCDGYDNDCDGVVDGLQPLECDPFDGAMTQVLPVSLTAGGEATSDRPRRKQPVEVPLVGGMPPSSDLLGYWPLNLNARDHGLSGRHGVEFDTELVADRHGAFDSAFRFEQGAKVRVENGGALVGVYEMSVCAWVRPEEEGQLPDRRTIAALGGANGWRLQVERDGTARFLLRSRIEVQPQTPGEAEARSEPGAVPFDAWSHICGVYHHYGAMVFVNGNLASGFVRSSEIGRIRMSATPFEIGHCPGGNDCPGGEPFVGAIDEVAVLRGAMTPREVRLLHRSALDWTERVLPDAGAAGVDLRVTEFGREIEFEVVGARPLADRVQDLPDSVVAYWPFGEHGLTDVVSGEAGVRHDGGAGLEGTTGPFGTVNALRFDGVDDWIDTGYRTLVHPDLDDHDEEFTVEFWARLDGGWNHTQHILGWKNDGVNNQFILSCIRDERSLLKASLPGGALKALDHRRPCLDKRWHHFAFVLSERPRAEYRAWYIDGVRVARSGGWTYLRPNYDLAFGATASDGEDGTEGAYLRGALSEVVIHDEAKSDAYVAARAGRTPVVRFLARTDDEPDDSGRYPWRQYRVWAGDAEAGRSPRIPAGGVFGPQNGFAGWWTFDELPVDDGVAELLYPESTANILHGRVDPRYGAGPSAYGGAAFVPQAGAGVIVDDVEALQSDDWTIEARVWLDGDGDSAVMHQGKSVGLGGRWIHADGDEDDWSACVQPFGNPTLRCHGPGFAARRWVHVVLRQSGDDLEFSKDGVTGTILQPERADFDGALNLGGASPVSTALQGRLDFVRIATSALQDDALMRGPPPIARTGAPIDLR